jgi:two-component system OmpR family sensor kinase/two-component system sensor histidine kinase BaeS
MFSHRKMRSRFHHHRPEWWPQNEHWPPPAPPWKGSRSRFFRRAGCLFFIINILVAGIALLVVGFAAHTLGFIQLPDSLAALFPWLFLLGFILFICGFGFLVWAGRGLRHLSAPFGDLLDASERVAQGDYTVRVTESGPPEVLSLARAFNSMAARLQISDDQRRSLLADVSHELRTPLTVIQGNLEGMLDGLYSADELHLRSLLEETQVLARLVDDLRTLVLAESGALILKKEPTDLAILINETVASFQLQAQSATVSLAVQIIGDPPLLNLDPARLREVLHNLIANALRYTPSGGAVHIRYEILQAEKGPQASLTIQDNGSGIPPDDLPHIFDRFYKSRDSSGMGLGLPIAKDLVEAHGGTIIVDSKPGNGAWIQISLPLP